jgi:hypothetical protein
VANIRRGSLVEVNVVDPIVRKGYRFKGPAEVHEPGSSRYYEGIALMRAAGSQLVDRVTAIVVIEVQEARPLVSPVCDADNVSEAEVAEIFRARYGAV